MQLTQFEAILENGSIQSIENIDLHVILIIYETKTSKLNR